MADWFLATEGVKIVKDNASLWPQVITAVSSAGAALFGVGMTHHFTRKREKDAADRKRNEERKFIATELVFLLERYASAWQTMRFRSLKTRDDEWRLPALDLAGVTGDWRVLETRQLLRLRSLESEHSALSNRLKRTRLVKTLAVDTFFQLACYRTGLRAFLLAAKLRREAGLPDSANLTFSAGTFRSLRARRKRLWHKEVLEFRKDKEAQLYFEAQSVLLEADNRIP